MIVLDTNTLIYEVQNKKKVEDFIDEVIAVPSSVIKELKGLSGKNQDAKLALEIAFRYKIIEVNSRGDKGVEEAALKTNSKVVTSDSGLRKRLSEKGIITMAFGINGVRV